MLRVALILLLFVLLTNGPHPAPEAPLAQAALAVRAEPVVVPREIAKADYGPLRLIGLWSLHGDNEAFGGISSLLVDADGGLEGLNDSGEAARFSLGGRGRIGALPRLPGEDAAPRRWQDSESMTRDPVSGRIWVGFERVQRICRYAPGFARIEGCVGPDAVRAWPEEGSLETLVRFPDGRFLAIAERANTLSGGFDALLWSADPVDADTPLPVHLVYRGAPGYRPTDAVWLGGDRLLVLERRLTLSEGFTARLTLVRLPKLAAGAELRGEVIARFEPPGPADNMEALALGRDKAGIPLLYVASDDNHQFWQRSLLFRFALPEDWVSAAPAP